ncbi:unnamed protein product [Heligmosomoides polygyrus]|uniref:Uncharacterized protein n=1 Tax=Heligmosomoides polygyrus TaxID=6339 RepID=A0A183GRY8_HELPZ|nr:unnamed protein product [Heligmosomoides polygyrus]
MAEKPPPNAAALATSIPIATLSTGATLEPVLSQSLPARITELVRLVRNPTEERSPDVHRGSETSAQSMPPAASANVNIRPPLNRGQSQIQMALNGSANFVGWNDSEGDIKRNWGSKRLRFLAKKYSLNQHQALNEAFE